MQQNFDDETYHQSNNSCTMMQKPHATLIKCNAELVHLVLSMRLINIFRNFESFKEEDRNLYNLYWCKYCENLDKNTIFK